LKPIFGLDIEAFLGRLTIEHASLSQLEIRVEASVIRHFEVNTGNQILYAHSLLNELLGRMANRVEVHRTDLEQVRLNVEEAIAAGHTNPAVQSGYVHFLPYEEQAPGDDYFEGVAARPAHIAQSLDVPRNDAMRRINEVLDHKQACILLSSSGQGKSTLAYRWAFDHFSSESRFRVVACQTEEQVGQIALFLEGRLRLGLPLLVVIDNLGHQTRLWNRLAERMAGKQILFLVTSREEDWFRYQGRTVGFTWDVVRPELDRAEALLIHEELRKRGRVHPDVTSAEWAFEQVRERKLLIEYVYLLTHGKLLSERLKEQVSVLREEDPGKLEALRLVSVAHWYNARVPAVVITQHAGFRGDAQQSLRSLDGEYLLCNAEGMCEGLHPIRSQHLIEILHSPLPAEGTVASLMAFLDDGNLVPFTRAAFSDPEIRAEQPLTALTARCAEAEPRLINAVAGACFDGEEQRHFLQHKHLYDESYRVGGEGRVSLLAMCDSPRGKINPLQSLREIGVPGSEASLDQLDGLAAQIQPRDPMQRLEHRFLSEVVFQTDLQRLVRDLPALYSILDWCYGADVNLPQLTEATELAGWESRIFHLSIQEASSLSFVLSRLIPERHRAWAEEHRQKLLGFFKYHTHTFTAVEEDCEEGQKIGVTFPVDWSKEDEKPHEQAVNRLFTLHRLLPYYDVYESQGIHLIGENAPLQHDDTHKRWTRDKIWDEIDTAKNGAWVRRCEDWYAADSLTSWLDQWNAARRLAASVIHQTCLFYTRQNRDVAAVTSLLSAMGNLQDVLIHLPSLPTSVPHEVRTRTKEQVRDWLNGLENLLRQWPEQNKDSPENRSNFLMRHNLKSALKALPKLHKVLSDVQTLATGTSTPDTHLLEDTRLYRQLADTMDFMFDRDESDSLSSLTGRNVSTVISEWSYSRRRRLIKAATEALRELEADGFEFAYPTDLVEDYPLRSLCIGVVIHDFRQLAGYLEVLWKALGRLTLKTENLEVTYIELLPLLPRKIRYGRSAFRANVDSARQLAEGHIPEGTWIFPREITRELEAVLRDVSPRSLEEMNLIAAFMDAMATYARTRRFLAVANSLLDSDEPYTAQWLRELQVNSTLDTEAVAIRAALEVLRQFVPPTKGAITVWSRLIHASESLWEGYQLVPPIEPLRDFGLGSDFDLCMSDYLNTAYINL